MAQSWTNRGLPIGFLVFLGSFVAILLLIALFYGFYDICYQGQNLFTMEQPLVMETDEPEPYYAFQYPDEHKQNSKKVELV
jgi:hypothetical protein